MKADVNLRWKSNEQKNFEKKNYFFSHWRKKQEPDPNPNPDPIPNPDPLVSVADPDPY
jgi:hypothetical protein